MTGIDELLNDKTIKAKEKTERLSKLLLDGEISADALVAFAETAKDAVTATCIEAFEFASKQQPAVVNKNIFHFVTRMLSAKAPRVKWESAKVIGNTAHLFKEELNDVINALLVNAEHEGTVVRWSAAFALGEILKLKTNHHKDLLPAIEAIMQHEEKNSIKKIYVQAIKKAAK